MSYSSCTSPVGYSDDTGGILTFLSPLKIMVSQSAYTVCAKFSLSAQSACACSTEMLFHTDLSFLFLQRPLKERLDSM